MPESKRDISEYVKPRKIILPIVIGLLVVGYMLYRNFNVNAFDNFHWTWKAVFWLFLSFMMVVVRDLAYMVRLRVLTEKKLSWKQCFEDIMCWEFASAIAPGAVGGGFAFAIYVISKEGITLGKSAAVVLFTSFLDGLFFLIMAPVIYFTIGREGLFENVHADSIQIVAGRSSLHAAFWFIYCLVIVYKVLVAYALFIDAAAVKRFLSKLFSIKWLRRWHANAEETGDEMIIASREIKKQGVMYWINSFIPTFISWSARFIIINCIISAFSTIPLHHYVCYGRQIVMGILMMGTPTPGGTGLAELTFSNFLGEFIDNAGLTVSLAFLWRLISYYPYLIMGVIIIPRWARRVYSK